MIEVIIWCDECEQVIETGKNLRCVRARAGDGLIRVGKKDFHAECWRAKERAKSPDEENKVATSIAAS